VGLGSPVKRILIDEKIERNLANAIASIEMSGTIFPAWEIELLRQYAYGEITEAEFLEITTKVTKIPNEILNSRSE
jgi:hypothetical protein